MYLHLRPHCISEATKVESDLIMEDVNQACGDLVFGVIAAFVGGRRARTWRCRPELHAN